MASRTLPRMSEFFIVCLLLGLNCIFFISRHLLLFGRTTGNCHRKSPRNSHPEEALPICPSPRTCALSPSTYSRADSILIYVGVSAYVGCPRGGQDPTETHPRQAIGAPAYMTGKQVFHTDAGDDISLSVLQTAAKGSVSRISSSWRVDIELAETRPDVVKALSEPWVH
jgi:hypothetical protein